MLGLSRVGCKTRSHVSKMMVTPLFTVLIAAISTSCAGHSAGVKTAPTDTRTVDSGLHVLPIAAVTPATMPPFETSENATPAELERALDEGKAVRRELEWVEREEAVASGEMAAGEYIVTYLITPADDYYDLEAAEAKLPAHHTTVMPGSAHVSVVVRDAADGRLVQGLNVEASFGSGANGTQPRVRLPFGWHPILNRYGENVVLPDGPFTLTIHIAMPTYARQDSVNGNRFAEDVTARFANITVSSDSLAVAAQRLAHGDGRDAVDLSRQEGTAVASSFLTALRGDPANGSQRRSGGYTVTVLLRRAQGVWISRDDKLVYKPPNSSVGPVNHMEISIRDVTTGRLVPDLNVRATILESRRKEIDTYAVPFMWHPWMNHYGLNVAVPGKGSYIIRVRADAPSFRRYGSSALTKFNRPVDVELRGLHFVAQ